MSQLIPFRQVDVFTIRPFLGNPVAVVLQADDLATADMQRIAAWTNLSETTFVLKPTVPAADYRLRIFTPRGELPFAGHPTIGSAHALLEAGNVTPRNGQLVQECGAGLISLRIEAGADAQRIFFTLPPAAVTPLDHSQTAELAAILRAPLAGMPAPVLVDVGARWVVAELPDADAVLAVVPDLARMRQQDERGRHTGVVIVGAHPETPQRLIEIRAFAPAHGIDEDPVCGSGAGSVAAFLRHAGQVGDLDFDIAQGQAVGRDGSIAIRIAGDRIEVGGSAVTCIDGMLRAA